MPEQTRRTSADVTMHDGDDMSHALDVVATILADVEPSAAASINYDEERITVQWSVSPSVRLARWLDADPERWMRFERSGDAWGCLLFSHDDAERLALGLSSGYGATRDAALTKALDKAGPTAEGEQHDA